MYTVCRTAAAAASRRLRISRAALVLLGLLAVSGSARALGGSEAERASGKLSAWVSVLPHRYFVQRIGGDRVEVTALVPPGANPHTFEPAPKQVNRLAKADVFFRTGLPFEEAFLRKLSEILPDFRVADLREGVPLRLIEGDEAEDQPAEPDGHEEEPDPHIWLSPEFSIRQARTILETLSALDPPGAEGYRKNFEAFSAEVKALDSELKALLSPVRGKSIFVYHPAFGYLTDEYGIRQESVEHGGDEPTPKRLRALIDAARAEGVRAVFVQPELSKKSAQAIADAVGGRVIVLNPLEEDWFATLRSIAGAIAAEAR